jgi:hypothetical protein
MLGRLTLKAHPFSSSFRERGLDTEAPHARFSIMHLCRYFGVSVASDRYSNIPLGVQSVKIYRGYYDIEKMMFAHRPTSKSEHARYSSALAPVQTKNPLSRQWVSTITMIFAILWDLRNLTACEVSFDFSNSPSLGSNGVPSTDRSTSVTYYRDQQLYQLCVYYGLTDSVFPP